jgi:hypothetical protein
MENVNSVVNQIHKICIPEEMQKRIFEYVFRVVGAIPEHSTVAIVPLKECSISEQGYPYLGVYSTHLFVFYMSARLTVYYGY